MVYGDDPSTLHRVEEARRVAGARAAHRSGDLAECHARLDHRLRVDDGLDAFVFEHAVVVQDLADVAEQELAIGTKVVGFFVRGTISEIEIATRYLSSRVRRDRRVADRAPVIDLDSVRIEIIAGHPIHIDGSLDSPERMDDLL